MHELKIITSFFDYKKPLGMFLLLLLVGASMCYFLPALFGRTNAVFTLSAIFFF